MNNSYPNPPDKDAAPLSGSIKFFSIFEKTKSSKKGACVFFVALIFRYKTDMIRRI